MVALLLEKNVDPDRRSQRDTPLTAAVSAGHLEVARALLESRRCDPGAPQGEDETLVTPGAATGAASSKRRAGQKPERAAPRPGPGRSAQTDDPLTLACARGDVAAVELLLKHGANPDGGGEGTCDTPLVAAAAAGHERVVERLCDAGAAVDGVARWAGRTALVAAAESEAPGASDCCVKLLARGADANFVSAGVVGRRLGYGAVHAAAARMDCELVRALVAKGADPNRRARNTDVENVRSRRAAAARALWGAEGAAERLDNTPLHLAVAAYINEAAKRRVAENQLKNQTRDDDGLEGERLGDDAANAAANADANASKDASETSELTNPANPENDTSGGGVSGGVPGEGERAALEVVKTLLACGADHGAFVVDSTPLHMAALGGATDVVDALMEAGADADARAPNGYTTPLEAAARYAADIILDRRDEREARAYRRSEVRGEFADARGAGGEDAARARVAALDVLDAYDDYDPYRDDSDDDSFVDDALDELAGEPYDDDDDDGGDFTRGLTPLMRRFGWTEKTYAQAGYPKLGSFPAGFPSRRIGTDAASDRPSRSRSSDSDSDSYYDGSRGDDDAAMAALRDAEGPLRAARHLVQRWSAEVTPHALVGACRAGDEATAAALLGAAEKNHAADPKRFVSVTELVRSVARNTTALHAAAESGCVPVARALVDRGAEVERRRPDDDATPLFAAARAGRPAMIAFLFSVGADIESLCKTADRREGHDTVTPLVEAVMSDQAAAAARLIALGADVRAPDSWMPPLLTATLRSNATITRMLLREGADPRVGVGGMTPLGLAVMTRQSDLARALLDWRGDGVDSDASDESDDETSAKKPRRGNERDASPADAERRRRRARDTDADERDFSLVERAANGVSALTLENLADPDEDPAVLAACRERLDAANAAKAAKLAEGKGPKRASRVSRRRVDPDEPIDAAVLDDGDPEMSSACQCPVCQRRGRDGDGGALDDKAFCAPVSDAKLSGSAMGASATASNGLGPYGAERHLTPLAAAAKLDDAETVRALLGAGADPERCSGGMPPLAHAAGKGSCAAIVALLEGGARLESAASLPLTPRDGRTLTPLGVASEAGELAAVETLLRRGADPNGPPGGGFEPPLCCAVTDPPDDDEGNPVVGVVRALVAAGADPNASKEDAQSPYSPLMVAAGAGSVAVVRELLDGGADLEHVVRVTVGDSGGPRGGPDRKCHITALLHAAYCNELDAVRFLLLQGAKLGSADREAMSLVCDHLRSKASVGVPDASATLSLLRHQADAEADEEDEKAEARLRAERARAAELKEERKRARRADAANAEAEALRKKAEEEIKSLEDAAAEAERLAAKVRKQEEYKKEQEARKKEAAAKRAEAKEKKAAAKAAAEREAAAEKAEQQKVLDEVQKMVADLEIKRKAEEAKREAKEKAERDAAAEEERRREKREKALEAAELERRAAKIAKDAAKVRGETASSGPASSAKAGSADSKKNASAGGKPNDSSLSSAAAAKAHLLARDEAEGFTGPPTKVSKEDAAEGASWAQPGGFFVFLCNDSTEEECYARSLMGAPAKFWDVTADHVKLGTTLVLYNFAARTLTGPYEALGPPKWNEHADAWQGGRGAPPGKRLVSAFPVQVAMGPSPIMAPVTASLGGDFRPSAGGLPLGSPDQGRRDVIVTKLRAAAREQGRPCPSAAERKRAASLARQKANAASRPGGAQAAAGGPGPGGPGPGGPAKARAAPGGGDAEKPKGWAAAAAGVPEAAPAPAGDAASGTAPAADAALPGAATGGEKPMTKKEKKAAARRASKEAAAAAREGSKPLPAPVGASAAAKGSAASSKAPPHGGAQSAQSAPQSAPAAAAASAAPLGGAREGEYAYAPVAAAPIGGGGGAPAVAAYAAAPGAGGYGAFGSGGAYGGAFASGGGLGLPLGALGGGAAGGGWNPLGGGGGIGGGFGGGALGGGGGGLESLGGAAPRPGGRDAGLRPYGTGGGYPGAGIGARSGIGANSGIPSSADGRTGSTGIAGGLFGGGGGIFSAPPTQSSAYDPSPYDARSAGGSLGGLARGGGAAAAASPPGGPPGFAAGPPGGYGAPYGSPGAGSNRGAYDASPGARRNGNQHEQPPGGADDDRPSFAQAEQLFPWLS